MHHDPHQGQEGHPKEPYQGASRHSCKCGALWIAPRRRTMRNPWATRKSMERASCVLIAAVYLGTSCALESWTQGRWPKAHEPLPQVYPSTAEVKQEALAGRRGTVHLVLIRAMERRHCIQDQQGKMEMPGVAGLGDSLPFQIPWPHATLRATLWSPFSQR